MSILEKVSTNCFVLFLLGRIPVPEPILFYEGMTVLDAIGPNEILSRLPNDIVQRAALASGSIQTDSGLVVG